MKAVQARYFRILALVWAGFFVLFLLTYLLVLNPQRSMRRQLQSKLAKAKQTYERTVQAVSNEARARLDQELAHLRSRLQLFVIDPGDSANLTLDISEIAKDKKLSSFTIRTGDKRVSSTTTKGTYIEEKNLHISFASGFSQFASFLNALERSRPVVFVDHFAIARSPRTESGQQVNMKVSVFVGKQQDS